MFSKRLLIAALVACTYVYAEETEVKEGEEEVKPFVPQPNTNKTPEQLASDYPEWA